MSDSLKHIFLDACYNLNVEKISACITLDVDINTVDSMNHNNTGLMYCVWSASSQACDDCLDRILQQPGLDINKQSTGKNTALHLASANNNHTAVAKLCAMSGIQLNTLASDGKTPLHYA